MEIKQSGVEENHHKLEAEFYQKVIEDRKYELISSQLSVIWLLNPPEIVVKT